MSIYETTYGSGSFGSGGSSSFGSGGSSGSGGGGKKNYSPVYDNVPLNGRIHVMENMKHVIDIDASDDYDYEGNGLKYFIVGGKDRDFYEIDKYTGKLSFIEAPDFEYPLDYDGDNVYDVIVRVVDSHGAYTDQPLWVEVKDQPEAPVAVDDYAMVKAGGQVGIKVLDNDFDPDGDALKITFAATDKISANGGTIKLNNNGTPDDFSDDKLVYRPAAGFTGVDTFTYAISDGNGGMDMATVKVKVKPVNQDPLAVDDHAMVKAGGQVGIQVLDNDFDPDGDALKIKFAATDKISANGGTIKLNNNGTPDDFSDDKLVYRPAAGFTGVDTFTYAISDGKGGMDMATVKIIVKGDDPGDGKKNLIEGTEGDDLLEAPQGISNDDIRGLAGHDTLRGFAGHDCLVGGAGNDKLFGNDGNDILDGSDRDNGGIGESDVLSGGKGKDTFILGDDLGAYYLGNGKADFGLIKDFEIGQDKLVLAGSAEDYEFAGNEIYQNGDLVANLVGVDTSELTSDDITLV